MRHNDEGWWCQNPYDKDEWFGPYPTKAEAIEAQRSFKRNWVNAR